MPATSDRATTQDETPSGSLGTGAPGLVIGGSCFPVCADAGDADGTFSTEAGFDCVVQDGLVARSGRVECTFLGGSTTLLAPPLDPQRRVSSGGVASRGFFVSAGRLFDAYGSEFVMRGMNNPHVWFDPPEILEPGSPFRYWAYDALDDIAAFGTNTIRIVWETEGGSPQLLRETLSLAVRLGMTPMLELHDVTGGGSDQDLIEMAQYYLSPDIRSILLDFEEYLLVNIANEWSGSDFRSAYRAAIELLRANGVNHTLVIDSNGFGQNVNSILDNGCALLEADPAHNLLFSVHMYERFAQPSAVTRALEEAARRRIPLIVGEFGWQHGGRDIDYQFIMAEAERLGVGFIAWSWKGNSGGDEHLDIAIDWQGLELSPYGQTVMDFISGSGFARPASIFQ
jgi:mannan endo-1,4-beta-mannosidase